MCVGGMYVGDVSMCCWCVNMWVVFVCVCMWVV